MKLRAFTADAWLCATMVLAIVHVMFVAVVVARVGLVAVLLWYVAPPLIALSAIALLAIALLRSWRSGDLPNRRVLTGLVLVALVVGSLALFRTFPSSHNEQPSEVPFRLPLDGPVTVAWGGPTLRANYHAVMPDQRWAYDLLVTVHGTSHRGSGSRLEDYYAFGRPVLAPANGVVWHVQDGEKDGPIGQWRVGRAAGNHVILQVADREFLVIAHLQAGSIAVRRGDGVVAGQVIGRVGNSGNSSEPHVHLHLQDRPQQYLAEGIPFYFHGYCARGAEIARGMPVGGRERWSRAFPGRFIGDIVEAAGGVERPERCRTRSAP
jgi:murein DD-endopeptidase MepM/ murein hydrolase activator NlpD